MPAQPGLDLVRRLADERSDQRQDGMNILQIKKYLGSL